MRKKLLTAMGLTMALTMAVSASAFAAGGHRGGQQDFSEEQKTQIVKVRAELSDEQKAQMLENCKEKMAAALESGKITQEEYDSAIAKIESGEFAQIGKGFGKGKGMKCGQCRKAAQDSEIAE